MRPNHTTLPRSQQRFFAKLLRAPSGCLEWQGAKAGGYGQINCAGTMQYAHRIAWILANGPIPDGLHVLHHCDNRACCEPSHLFLGTLADNNLDRVRKGRSADIRGEKNNLAKLTDDQVREMRALHVPRSHEWGRNALARRFGVSETTVDRIINHEMWTHI